MSIEEILEQIEDILEAGTKLALTSKAIVDIKSILACLEEIRLHMPEEIAQAQDIVADRNEIRSRARQEAVTEVTAAQEQSREIQEKTNARAQALIKKAEDHAEKVKTEANEQAKKTVDTANKNAENTIQHAQQKADAMIEEHEITRQAKDFAAKLKNQANEEASTTIATAKAQSEKMVADATNAANELTENTRIKTEDMLNKANKWSNEIRTAANDFVEDIMQSTDAALLNSLNEVRNARKNLASPSGQRRGKK